MSAREQNCTKPLKKIVSFWDVFSYPKGVLFACLFFSGGGGIYSKKKHSSLVLWKQGKSLIFVEQAVCILEQYF